MRCGSYQRQRAKTTTTKDKGAGSRSGKRANRIRVRRRDRRVRRAVDPLRRGRRRSTAGPIQSGRPNETGSFESGGGMHFHIIRNYAVVRRIRFGRHRVHTDMIVVSCDVGDCRCRNCRPKLTCNNGRIWIDAPPPRPRSNHLAGQQAGVGRTIDFDCWRR